MEAQRDIYTILESFIRQNFSSKYSEEDLLQLIGMAKNIVRQKLEETPKDSSRREERRPSPPPEPDLEEKLRQSLRERLKQREEIQ